MSCLCSSDLMSYCFSWKRTSWILPSRMLHTSEQLAQIANLLLRADFTWGQVDFYFNVAAGWRALLEKICKSKKIKPIFALTEHTFSINLCHNTYVLLCIALLIIDSFGQVMLKSDGILRFEDEHLTESRDHTQFRMWWMNVLVVDTCTRDLKTWIYLKM
jgi:hypothetical protein